MTLPFMDWDDVTPDDVVETVVMPDQLGTALQDQSEEKYKQQSADRFPGYVDGTLAGGPLASGPLGMINGMFGKFVSKIANADPATIEKPKDLQPLVPGFFDLPLSDLFAPLLNALMGVGGGVLGGALSGIADFMSGRWDQVDSVVDGQLALNDQVDLLSPLQDYGRWYAAGASNMLNTGTVPFNTQVGPVSGCHLSGSRAVLDDKGAWDISARLAFDSTLLGGTIIWVIRVYHPDGTTVFSEQWDQCSHPGATSREMGTTVVVPTAGFQVAVEVTSLNAGRSTAGGPSFNRLSVSHISRSTEHPIEP